MQRISPVKLVFLIVLLAGIAVVPCMAGCGPFQGSGDLLQITTNPRYDRNPSLFQAKDGRYWLFYTRGRDPTGIRDLNGYIPDLDFYDIYYRNAKTIPGLKIAQERMVPGPSTPLDNAQRDVAALQTGDGTIWVFASTGLGPGSDMRLFYYQLTSDGWSGPDAVPGLSYVAHVDALVRDGKIWVFYDVGYELFVISYDVNNDVWTSPVSIHADATIAKAITDREQFYVVWTTPAGEGISLSTSADGATWDSTHDPIADWPVLTDWDPVLARDGKVFRLIWAPSDTEQFLATTTSLTPENPSSWSPPVRLTTAMYGDSGWWDFWPEPILKGRTYTGSPALVFTSERNSDGTDRADGNIWLYVSRARCS